MGIGAASTSHGMVIFPPTGANVVGGRGCLSKLGLNAASLEITFLREENIQGFTQRMSNSLVLAPECISNNLISNGRCSNTFVCL